MQRFAEFVQQPRVLDGDNGLSGEVCDQFDLFGSEFADFLPVDGYRSYKLAFPEHWNDEQSASPREFNHPDRSNVALFVSRML